MSRRPLLQLRDLSLAFAQGEGQSARCVDALSGVHLELHAGETLALLGESGCGKSLTALALMRLLPAAARYQSGRALLTPRESGVPEDIFRIPEQQMRHVRGKRLAMIFQEPATSLNPVLRIGDQVAEAVQLHRQCAMGEVHAEVISLLQQVGLPDPERVARAYPFELSGGMKQRAMIAMALAGNPEILLADEPTTALDVTIQAQILDLIRCLQQARQMGVLLITHDLALVASRADRVAVMYAGQIVEQGAVAEVLQHPAHPYTRALLAALPERARHGQALQQLGGRVPALGDWPAYCRFSPRCADQEAHCLKELPPLVRLPLKDMRVTSEIAHDALCWRAAEPPVTVAEQPGMPLNALQVAVSAPVLEVIDLQIRYHTATTDWLEPLMRCFRKSAVDKPVVDGVSLQLHPGETLALVGESGCGKTTIARAILGLQPPSAGSIALGGMPISGQGIRPPKGWRRDIQMVFQDPFASLDPRQRIRAILAEGPQALGLPAQRYDENALNVLLERVGLPAQALDRYPHEFSGGQRQRIAIARALAVSPKVLICDEPTSALDVSVQAQILNLLKELQANTGMAYLFITHNFGVVRYMADRVAVMQDGRFVENGPVAQVLDQPQHTYTQALLDSVPVLR